MNNYNASLQRQQGMQEFTNQALEVVLKLLNGYDLQMAEHSTPLNDAVVHVIKGREFSTYLRQDLIKSKMPNKWMSYVKANAPVSEFDKIKRAVARGGKDQDTPEAVKLAMGITGIGTYARLCDYYEDCQYVQLLNEVCSFATPEQVTHTTDQLKVAQLPFLEELVVNASRGIAPQKSVLSTQNLSR